LLSERRENTKIKAGFSQGKEIGDFGVCEMIRTCVRIHGVCERTRG